MFEGYSDAYNEFTRLYILRLLCEQADYRLTDTMLDDLLVSRYAVNRGRAYVRAQIAWLQNSAGAVTTEQLGSSLICTLTETGADHALKRAVIPGIKHPAAGRT